MLVSGVYGVVGMNFTVLKEKLKKGREVYVAVALALVALIAYFVASSKRDDIPSETTSFDAYITSLENKIGNVIGQIEGCDGVQVAIACSVLEQSVYLTERTETTKDGVETVTEKPVLSGGKPVVTEVLAPQISGVAVVAWGSDRAALAVRIKQLVVTLLDVEENCVQVLTYNS